MDTQWIKERKLKWEDVMVKDKYYTVKYKYNGKEFECFGAFKQYEFGNLSFKCDNGEWLAVKPFNIISVTTS